MVLVKESDKTMQVDGYEIDVRLIYNQVDPMNAKPTKV
jgi:hypothetical protein